MNYADSIEKKNKARFIRATDKLFKKIEQGYSFNYILAAVIILFTALTVKAGIDLDSRVYTVQSSSGKTEVFYMKRPSSKAAEKTKDAVAESNEEAGEVTDNSGETRSRYLNYIIGKIERNKRYPESERARGRTGEVCLNLVISRDGKVDKVQIIKEDGSKAFTHASINAIKKSVPFEPFPVEIHGEVLAVKLLMQYNLDY